eukprot:COSAG06_NODE_45027_length_358_cov_0.795367_1_plen_21_part_10
MRLLLSLLLPAAALAAPRQPP